MAAILEEGLAWLIGAPGPLKEVATVAAVAPLDPFNANANPQSGQTSADRSISLEHWTQRAMVRIQ